MKTKNKELENIMRAFLERKNMKSLTYIRNERLAIAWDFSYEGHHFTHFVYLVGEDERQGVYEVLVPHERGLDKDSIIDGAGKKGNMIRFVFPDKTETIGEFSETMSVGRKFRKATQKSKFFKLWN